MSDMSSDVFLMAKFEEKQSRKKGNRGRVGKKVIR